MRSLVVLLALAGCSSAPRKPDPMAWPPPRHPEWDRLDPALCHPYPCRADDPRVEWRGDWNMPSLWEAK